jgi:hypothetical protein
VKQTHRTADRASRCQRHEVDAPIRVWLNIRATANTELTNLKFTSNGKETTLPLELAVMPREKRHVLEVAPRNSEWPCGCGAPGFSGARLSGCAVSSPWGFRFEYRWSAGTVPLDMFGVPHPQVALN